VGDVLASRRGVPGAPPVPGRYVRPGGAAGTSPAGTARRAPPGTRRTRPSRGTYGARRGAPREHRYVPARRCAVLERPEHPVRHGAPGGCTCSTRRYRRTNMSVPGGAPRVPARSWIQSRAPGPRDGRTGEGDGRTGCATGPRGRVSGRRGHTRSPSRTGSGDRVPVRRELRGGGRRCCSRRPGAPGCISNPPMTSRRGPPPWPSAPAPGPMAFVRIMSAGAYRGGPPYAGGGGAAEGDARPGTSSGAGARAPGARRGRAARHGVRGAAGRPPGAGEEALEGGSGPQNDRCTIK